MPIHQIRANDGSIIEVEAPANTPPDQVLQLAKKQQLSAQIEAKKRLPPAGSSDAWRGLKQRLFGVPGDFGALQVLKGSLTDDEEAMRAGMARMEASEKDVADLGVKKSDTFLGAIEEGPVAFATDYIPLLTGQVAGMFLEMIGLTAGASALAGPAGTVSGVSYLVGKNLLKKNVQNEAKKIAKEKGIKRAKDFVEKSVATELTRLQGTKEGKRRINEELRKFVKPATAGVVYSSWGAGETMGRVMEEIGTQTDDPEEQLRLLQEKSGSKLAMVSGAHAIANMIGYKIFGRAMEGLAKPTRSYLLNIAKRWGIAGIQEAPVEALQTALELYAADLPLNDAEAIKEFINAAGAGFFMPLAPATIGAIRTGRAPKETKDETTKTDATKVTDETIIDADQRSPESQIDAVVAETDSSEAQINAEALNNEELNAELEGLYGAWRAETNPKIKEGILEVIEVYEAEQERRAADPELKAAFDFVGPPRPETEQIVEKLETTVNPEFSGMTFEDIQNEITRLVEVVKDPENFPDKVLIPDYINELQKELDDRILSSAQIIPAQEDTQTAGPPITPQEDVQETETETETGTAELERGVIDEPITKETLLENGFEKDWFEYREAPVGLLSDPEVYLYYENLWMKGLQTKRPDLIRLNNVIDASNKILNRVERPTDAIIDYRIRTEPDASRETIEQQEGEKDNVRQQQQQRSTFDARVPQFDDRTTRAGTRVLSKPQTDTTAERALDPDRTGVDGRPSDLPATARGTRELATPLRGEELEKELKAFGERISYLLTPGLKHKKDLYGTTEYRLVNAWENNLKLFKIFQAENPRTVSEALKLLNKNRSLLDPATIELVTAFRNAKNIQEVPFTFGRIPYREDAAGYYDPQNKFIIINDKESVWDGNNIEYYLDVFSGVSKGDIDVNRLSDFNFYLNPVGSKNTISSQELDALPDLPNTILHEIRHALTMEGLDKHVIENPGNLDSPLEARDGSQIGTDAINIFAAYRRAYPYTYASTNIYDFFAEATSSPEIMAQLNSLPSVIKRQKTSKSLLDNFIFVLKRLLGLKTSNTLFADFLALSPKVELGIETFDADATANLMREEFTRKVVPDKYGSALGEVNTLQETDPEIVDMLDRGELGVTFEQRAREKVRRNLERARDKQQEVIRGEGLPTDPQFAATPTKPLEEQIAEARERYIRIKEQRERVEYVDGQKAASVWVQNQLRAEKRLRDLLKQRDKESKLKFAATPTIGLKKYKAKKIGPGHYEYRGYEIEQMKDSDDKHWNLKPLLADGEIDYIGTWTDGANTLSDAKAMIDDFVTREEKEIQPGLFAATPPGPPTEVKVINQAGKLPETDDIPNASKTSTQRVNPENYKELINLSGQVVQSQPVFSKGLMQGIRDTISKLTSWAQKYYIQFLSLPQIQELFPELPGIKSLQDNLENRANDLWKKSENLNEQMKAIKEIEAKYSPEIIKKWNMITFELSKQNINPALAKNRDHGLVQEFKTLPRELQGLALGMHRNYMLRAKETLDALEKLTGKDVDYLRRQFKRKKLEFYQPFMRQGDYWFDYEIQTEQGTETVVIAAQTPAERERLKKEAASKKDFVGFTNEAYSRTEAMKIPAPNRELYNFTNEALDKANIPADVKEDLQDKLHEHFLSLFRVDSVQAAGRHRHGFPGYVPDLVYAYGNASYRGIKNINDLTYLPDIKSALNEIKTNVDKGGKAKRYAKGVYEAINNRASFYLNPTAESWASTAGFLSYAWYIGGNLSSAFVNLTQMPIVVAPVLGADYGYGKAVSALDNARKLYFNGNIEGKASLRKKESWKTDDLPDYTMAEGFNAEQKERYGDLFKKADQTMTLTRGLIHENIDFNTDTKLGRTTNLVNQSLGWTFKNSERANRELTLVAAYDLAIEAGKPKGEAIEEAIKLTVKAHSHALPEVGPLIFQSGIGKVAFTFKRFAQAQIYLVSQLLLRSFNLQYHISGGKYRKLNAKEKNIARSQLLGISGMAYMFAGVQGLPFYGAADMLASLLSDDEEDPFLLDDWVKQSVGQVGYKGPLSAAFNVDIASRTGFRGLMWRADRRRREEVGEAVYIAEHFLGPSWSILTGIDRGAGDINEGNTMRGLEQMTPTWIRNQIKTFRFATEGATTRKGLKIVDDPNAYNLFMQILGFSDSDLSAAYERVAIMKFKEKKIEGWKTKLLLNYYLATKAGDSKGIKRTQKKINKFNKKNPELAITGETLNNSRKTFDRKALEAVHGVTLNPRLRDRLIEESDYDEDEEDFFYGD